MAQHRIKLFFIALLWLPTQLFAGGEIELIRTIEKAYAVSPTDMLTLDNRYGKVHIDNWDRREISIKITITSRAKDEYTAERRLKAIRITEKKDGTSISLKTETEEPGTLVRSATKGIKVDYMVKIPRLNPITLKNRFGDVYIADREGNLNLHMSYGKLTSGALNGQSNEVRSEFGDASIANFGGGSIQFSFGELMIGQADNLKLNTNAANVTVSKVNRLDLNSNLGKLVVKQAGTIAGEYSATKVSIEELKHYLDLEVKYGTVFQIEEVLPEFDRIKLIGNYCSFDIEFHPAAKFNLSAELQYGKMDYEAERVSMTILEDQSLPGLTTYRASFGGQRTTSTNGSQVIIHNKYGNVRIRQ
ncbi:MAG: hypothetical protein AAGI38_15335 [Bacteroidota bacterium]